VLKQMSCIIVATLSDLYSVSEPNIPCRWSVQIVSSPSTLCAILHLVNRGPNNGVASKETILV